MIDGRRHSKKPSERTNRFDIRKFVLWVIYIGLLTSGTAWQLCVLGFGEWIGETSFYRESICEGGLSRNSVCPSIRLSVARVDCDKTSLNDALRIFWYHTKGQSLCYSDTDSVWWATPLPSEICAQSDPPPSKNADFDRFPLITSQP